MSEEEYFPNVLSSFTDKRDAIYDGDPNGDYIVAGHINKLQDSIQHIEEAIGIHPQTKTPLADRIQQIEKLKPMRVDSVGYFPGDLNEDLSYTQSILEKYKILIIKRQSTNTRKLIDYLQNRQTSVYGIVDAREELSLIQSNIGAWKNLNAAGIYLEHFGEEVNSTREKEQQILNSVSQAGLSIIVETEYVERLTDNKAKEPYNPLGKPFSFPNQMIVRLNNFAYDGRYHNNKELLDTVLPIVQSLKSNGLHIMGSSYAQTDTQFQYVQAAAILFSLDYLYNGSPTGETLESRTPTFNWPSTLSDWKTDNPLVFLEGNTLYRNIKNGTIQLFSDHTVSLSGLEIPSSLISWYTETVPGEAIKEGSIDPNRLSTYDIERIVELINNASDEIKINSVKINSDEGGAGLPVNIPASNMIQNVIEAINKKNNPNTLQFDLIQDISIESLSASKLTGHITKAQMKGQVIQAINEASNQDVFINVPKIKSVDVESTGTIKGQNIQVDNLTARAANITEAISTQDLKVLNYLTGNDGEFLHLYVQDLEVETLSGLKDLYVENLTADNMNALVLDAVEAQIALGKFDSIVTHALKSEVIQTDLITALNAITDKQITNTGLFGEAVIQSASIKDLSASKLSAGDINTALISLSSPEGHLSIKDNDITIYDAIDEEGIRRKRVLLGDVSEVGSNNQFGLAVFGPDGQTRLYDHTGVYNAGIHQNAISNEKIQENAIDERVIKAGSIFAKHIQAKTITGDLIAAETIIGNNILSETITAKQIAADAITARQIKAGSIESGHLKAALIEGKHIKAAAIDSTRLSIGFELNLIKDGYDSFEQLEVGPFEGIALAGTTTGEIINTWHYEGKKSLRISGNAANNIVRLGKKANPYQLSVMPGYEYFISSYARTESQNNTPVRIGLIFNDEKQILSPVQSVKSGVRPTRIFHKIKVPDGVLRASVILSVDATNTGVLFDALQVELADENKSEPGPFKPTATTTINGDNIETGRIDARHIHIGAGTVFGTNNDIIDITNEGIKAKSKNGFAMLNAKGLEIEGGAFSLKSGLAGKTFIINGDGLSSESTLNKIELDPDNGFRIISKKNNKILLDTDPESGEIRMAGTFKVYDKDNPAMSWTIQDKINDLEQKATAENIHFGTNTPTLTNQPAVDWKTTEQKNSHLNDMYYNESNGYAYRFTKKTNYEWIRIKDSDIESTLEEASEAKKKAESVGASLENFQTAWERQTDIRVSMKVGYSSFTTTSPTHIYICGVAVDSKTLAQKEADIDGEIYLRDTKESYVIPKQALNTSGAPEGKVLYITFDNARKELFLMWYETTMTTDKITNSRWRKQNGTTVTLTESIFIIGEIEVS